MLQFSSMSRKNESIKVLKLFLQNSNVSWLVVLTIWKNISQWVGLSHILWKIKFMFQTTNQFPSSISIFRGLHRMRLHWSTTASPGLGLFKVTPPPAERAWGSHEKRWTSWDIYGKKWDIYGKKWDIYGKKWDIYGKKWDVSSIHSRNI